MAAQKCFKVGILLIPTVLHRIPLTKDKTEKYEVFNFTLLHC